MKQLRDKVAAVTGAGSGIGRSLAIALAREGAALALSDIDEAGLAETVDEVAAHDVRVTRAIVDVADREAVYGWADAVASDHDRVNLVFNNAGVALASTIEEMSFEDFEWLMGINFWGVVHGTKAFLPHLVASGEGHVVNISSVFGLIGVPGQGAYNAAKFAVRGFTECLRQELAVAGHPVSATSVHPGGIRTQIARNARYHEKPGEPTHEEAAAHFDRVARTTPDKAAAVILDGVKRDRRRVLVGLDARLIDWVQRAAPAGYQVPLTAIAKRIPSPL